MVTPWLAYQMSTKISKKMSIIIFSIICDIVGIKLEKIMKLINELISKNL